MVEAEIAFCDDIEELIKVIVYFNKRTFTHQNIKYFASSKYCLSLFS